MSAAGRRTVLPPLRLPRGLLDPRRVDLGSIDGDGLVAVLLRLDGDRVEAIDPWPGPSANLPLALTPPVDPHVHLDKAFSGPIEANPEGTMAAAMAANGREAAERQPAMVEARADRALELAWQNGLRALRSHIDSLGPWASPSWEVLEERRRRWQGRLDLQLVALVPIHHWLTPEGEALARRLADGRGVLGGVLGAPFPPSRQDGEALLALLRLAERHGCAVDLHIDESTAHHGRGMRLLAQLLATHRLAVPVVCSHASSMGLMAERPQRRLAEALAAAEVGVVALPTTNLWLLDKQPRRTPSLRPLAPIRQLQEAGVEVAVGGDNVQDPWYPGGNFDPLDLLRFSVPACHLQPWRRQGLSPFTTAASRLMGLAWDGVVRVGGPADLVVLGAASWQDLLARPPQRRVLRAGHWLPPPEAEHPSPLLAALPVRR